MEKWGSFDAGHTIGAFGSEGGTILLDEEHADGARITIERGGQTAPFAITCGVYGSMVHTRFFATEAEARDQCDKMKAALSELIAALHEGEGELKAAGEACSRFVDRFP